MSNIFIYRRRIEDASKTYRRRIEDKMHKILSIGDLSKTYRRRIEDKQKRFHFISEKESILLIFILNFNALLNGEVCFANTKTIVFILAKPSDRFERSIFVNSYFLG